jgi:hypothetical protein
VGADETVRTNCTSIAFNADTPITPHSGACPPGVSCARPTPNMAYMIPPWRSFRTLDSNNEAACASVCCSFSFATLEVASCHPGMASFALTEQQQIDAWRWAICSTRGLVLHTGSEPTQTGAKRVAEEALRLEEA